MDFPILSFPKYEFRFSSGNADGQRLKIFDIVREKYVVLTPEEWVRQHLVHYLLNEKLFPRSLMSVEKMLKVNGLNRRYDLVAYSRNHLPSVLAECKSPFVAITQEAFDQAARYNLSTAANYFVLSNGLNTFCCTMDHERKQYQFLKEIPLFANL